jgi:hypothetical protein
LTQPAAPAARYALYRSYVLLARPPIEPISHPIRAWLPLGKAQRIEEVTYDPLLKLQVRLRRVKLTSPTRPNIWVGPLGAAVGRTHPV